MNSFGRSVLTERDEARIAAGGGFPFLLAFGSTWLVSGVLAFVLPIPQAALVFLFQGAVGTPLAFALERLLGLGVPRDNLLTPLLIQVAMSQLPALLAVAIIYMVEPLYVPAGFAAILGGHFLPYAWIHKTGLYVVMAVFVSGVPFVLALVFGGASFYLVGFVVGAALIVSALVLRARIEREPGARICRR